MKLDSLLSNHSHFNIKHRMHSYILWIYFCNTSWQLKKRFYIITQSFSESGSSLFVCIFYPDNSLGWCCLNQFEWYLIVRPSSFLNTIWSSSRFKIEIHGVSCCQRLNGANSRCSPIVLNSISITSNSRPTLSETHLNCIPSQFESGVWADMIVTIVLRSESNSVELIGCWSSSSVYSFVTEEIQSFCPTCHLSGSTKCRRGKDPIRNCPYLICSDACSNCRPLHSSDIRLKSAYRWL